MCWLHQGPGVGHVLTPSEPKEGSQTAPWMAERMEQNLSVFSGKGERKDELHSALSFVSLMAGSRP